MLILYFKIIFGKSKQTKIQTGSAPISSDLTGVKTLYLILNYK